MTNSQTRPLAARSVAILTLFAFVIVQTVAVAKDKVAPFDHSAFNTLLSTLVSGGKINYSKFKGSVEFTSYLKSLENATPASMSTNDQLAFWINAYNALVIKNVLDNPGIRQPTDVKGFFDKKKFSVAGKSLTLNEIENDVVRKKFKEPLIHFGLVCAAQSCPQIISKVYDGKTVRAQLAKNAKQYLASKQNRFDNKSATLYLSKIFEWYRDDFGGEKGLREFAKKYGPPAMIKGLNDNPNARIVSLDYDWTINSK